MSALPKPLPTAAELLRRAWVERVAVQRDGDALDVWSARDLPPDLLDGLRLAKAEVLALLSGDRCRFCGATLGWSQPGALAFADGSAAHVACADRAEVARLLAAGKRAVESPDALADEAEVTLRGELP
jgi:hypothetical protein